jgi:uncharacterized protein YutE (UPF0331/DUF86 family)
MYSLRQRYKTVRKHLDDLHHNSKPSEALLATTFVVEKIFRRVLLQLLVSAGFNYDLALELCGRIRGLDAIKSNWKFYDPKHRTLIEIIGNDNWKVIAGAAERRNALVHGSKHDQEKVYRKLIPGLLKALDEIKKTFEATYGYGGWKGLKERSSSHLHNVPLVNV